MTGLANSAVISATVLAVSTITSTMAAFSFAKLRFPFKNTIFLMLLSTMMVPVVVLLVPQFIIYSRIRWIDTLLPMIVPYSLCYVNNIFFLRQYMIGLPSGYLEAAKIDGCTYFGAYRRIFLPLSRTAIIANAIMLFMTTWNDYFSPLIFTHSASKQTIQVAIAMLSSHYEQQTDIPVVMAASLVAVLPVLILFVTCQKYFTDSFAMTGIKG
jgi:multiple sugar transport system permease protein